MNFKEEIFKAVQTMVDRAIANCKVDRTYESVIKEITPKDMLFWTIQEAKERYNVAYQI